MIRLRRLFCFALILFIIKVNGVQTGSKLLVCHVPLELKIFADSSYQASSADLKSCNLITLSSVNVLFLSSSNSSLASVMVSEKRSLQLLKQQTPEAEFSFSLRSANIFPATRHLKTIFNGTASVALLIEFLKINKLKSFDIAWDLIQSTPDYVPTLKTLKAALAKEGFNLTTTIGVEIDRTDAFHVSKITTIVDHIFLVPSYNRHYSGVRSPLVAKKLEQAFDTLELNEGNFLKLYSTLNLSWKKIVVGLSLQTLVWKLNVGATIVDTQFNQKEAVLQLQNYYESCKNANSTWRLQQQPNPFYKLAVAPTNDQWMIHVDPITLGRRVDLIRQYDFGGIALYDYYQDDFAGVCNANGKVYPLINQAGQSLFNNRTTIPFPEIDPNGGLCIPFLGLTSECKGVFNFGTPKLNTSSIGLTSSTTSSSVTAAKTTFPVENHPTTAHTSSKYSPENTMMAPLSSFSTLVTTTPPISSGARSADAEYLIRTRRSSVSSQGTEPSFSYVNPPGVVSTEMNLAFPSTFSDEIKLPVAESLVTTSVTLKAATEAFLMKNELWRDNQTHLSGFPETSALNQNEESNVTAFDQDIQQPTSPNTVIDDVPTTSLPQKLETLMNIENNIEPITSSTVLFTTFPPKVIVKSKAVAVKQTLSSSEIEAVTDFAAMPTIPSSEPEVATTIQVETEPASTKDSTGFKLIDEITTVSSKSASLHESFTETTSLPLTEGETQKLTDDKSANNVALDVTSPVTVNISVSRTEQPSLLLENNENTSAPAETESDGISTSRSSAFDNQQLSSQYSGLVDDLVEQTTSELPVSLSDTRQDWTSPISHSAAFETSPTGIKTESLYVDLFLTSEKPQTNGDDAISSEMTAAGYQDTISPFPHPASSEEQFAMSEVSSAAAEISTESYPVFGGFPSTIESIPPLTSLATADQDIMKLSTEHFSLTDSSMEFVGETQFPSDFHHSTQNAPIRKEVGNTDHDQMYLKSIASTDTYFSTEHEDIASTVSSQGPSNELFITDEFSTTAGEISEMESSTAPDGLSPTAGIPNTLEPSSKTEHLSSSLASSGVNTNTIQLVETSEDNLFSESSLPYSSSPYYLKATEFPKEIQDVSTFSSQYSSNDQDPVSELFSVDVATSTEGSLFSASFSPIFESNIPVDQVSSIVFIPNIMDSLTQEQVHGFTLPNSQTSVEERYIGLSTPSSPYPFDASTEDTQLVGNENESSTTNFSNWQTYQSEITSPQPEESKFQESVGETSPTESTLSFYSTSVNLDIPSLSHASYISTDYQDEVSSFSPQSSSNQQITISALPLEFAETSPEGNTVFEHTLRPNLVDPESTMIIPNTMESSTEYLLTSTSGNSDLSSEELQAQETNLSTTDSIILGVRTVGSQLVNSGIYPTTRASLVNLPNEETFSSFVPLVTDGNGSGDNTPVIDTLKPTENEFVSPRDEDLLSSVEVSNSSDHVSRGQALSTFQSSSLVTRDLPVTRSFQFIDTSAGLNDPSSSLGPLLSSTTSPHFSEFEMGSGDESSDVSTLAPIFENEGSGQEFTSTLEEVENLTPGFLNATDKPATSISEIHSTINPLFSSPLTDIVPDASTRQEAIAAFSFKSTSARAVTDTSFVQEMGEDSSNITTEMISETVSLSSSPNFSAEVTSTSTSPTTNDIPSTKVPSENTFLPTHFGSELEPSTSQSTFSLNPTSLSSQNLISDTVTRNSLPSIDDNKVTSSTTAWSSPSFENSFDSSTTSTDSKSSLSTSTTNTATSNTSPNNFSTAKPEKVPLTYSSESITASSSTVTASSATSSSTPSRSTSSLTSSMAPTSTTVISPSTTSSFQPTKFSSPYSEIPTTSTEIPSTSLWSLLISKLNLTNGLPIGGEYSSISSYFWSNATSFSLNIENIKEIPSSFTSSPSGNAVSTGTLLFETRPFWLLTRPSTEAPSFSTTRSPSKETNRTPWPVSRTTADSLDLFETRPYWLLGSTTKPIKLALPSTPNILTSRESSSTLTSSTKALHTSDSEMRPSRTTEIPPATITSLGAQQLSTSLNPNIIWSPCTENCTEESKRNSSIILVAKDVSNNVVVHLNVSAYMGEKKQNSSFNFEKWLGDLNRFLNSPSSSMPQTEEIKPSPICEAAGNSILLKSLFCSNESFSTEEKIRFSYLMNLTRRLAPAIIANLTTAMNLSVAVPDNDITLFSRQPNISNETTTESTISMSTASSTQSTIIEQHFTSFFDSQNVSTTFVISNLSDVRLPTVLNSSLESFMLNLTELLKDAHMNDLISAVNHLNHSIPEGFLENLIQSNNSEDAGLFNQTSAENDAKDSVTTQVPTSTFLEMTTTPIEYDIFQKNFWKTNRRNPIRMLQRVAGPGLGIIPSIHVPLRTTAKPVSSIFSFLAKPAATRQ